MNHPEFHPNGCLANGEIEHASSKRWFKDGFLHRENGPALICRDGRLQWYKMGSLHREDGPAIICYPTKIAWYKEGRLHREDGPAILSYKGEEWWQNGKKHRKNGPAVDSVSMKCWFYNGKLHNTYGPAVLKRVYLDRICKISSIEKAFYIKGKFFRKEEWWEKIPKSRKEKLLFSCDFESSSEDLIWKEWGAMKAKMDYYNQLELNKWSF